MQLVLCQQCGRSCLNPWYRRGRRKVGGKQRRGVNVSCKLKKEPKKRKHKKRTSEKMIVFDHLTEHNSTVLNNELNWRNTDWAKEASEIKYLLAKNQNNKCK